jgi:DNA-binding MarR family transcriptional regulator
MRVHDISTEQVQAMRQLIGGSFIEHERELIRTLNTHTQTFEGSLSSRVVYYVTANLGRTLKHSDIARYTGVSIHQVTSELARRCRNGYFQRRKVAAREYVYERATA